MKVISTIFVIIFNMAFVPAPQTEIKQGIENHILTEICFGENCIKAEVADTDDKRHQGLMYRTEMDKDKGMIFVFEQEATHSFWMKNTLIPLDMIWVNSNFEVVHIEHAVPCEVDEANCPLYSPSGPALYVIEVNKGYAKEKQIEVGSKVDFKL